MALPKQVQAQQQAAEEFDTKIRAANAAPGEPGDDTPPEPPEPTPAPEPKPEPKPQTVTPKAPADDDAAAWKQKFQTLQGMYNSQVPALQAQIKELTASVKTLTEQLAAAKEPPKKPPVDEPLVSKKDVDAFGEDLVDLARRIAREEFGQREKGYKEEIAELRSELQAANGKVEGIATTSAQTARDTFFERLSGRLPTWEQVQATEQCQAFLASRIPGLRGATWNDALVQAASELDVDAVMDVFDEFFVKHPDLNPKAKPEPTPAPAKRELQRQVTPAKSATATTPPAQKKTYSTAEYERESMKILRLNQQGRYQEAQAIETELNLALAEGRIKV